MEEKKRGRKPRKKSENDGTDKVRKKRGRKPRSNITINNNPTFIDNEPDLIIKIDSEQESNNIIKEYNTENIEIINSKNKVSKLCWNCSQKFYNSIYPMPIKYINNIFYTYGDFCSPECSVRYCFDNMDDKHNIYNIINLFYFKQNNKISRINPAPSKLTLTDFGGTLSVDEYRLQINKNNLYNTTIDPIIHINNRISSMDDSSHNIINNSNNYNLHRRKPINTSSNITNIMQLKIS
ncbi:MAG: hypothetical protein CMG46_01930 [Candidatus Marinimicrobia bacterium]|nr:hypothetical protein [Candidatus Neomarinimicrobiota bacterium]|tara:strand:+ start:112 stop:822 length:711 start_codon:yes stop_codon:yes gene_type:complete